MTMGVVANIIGPHISDGFQQMADSIVGAATKKATEEGIKAVGTSWRAAAGVITACIVVGIGYFGYTRIDFFGIAKKKSKEIMIETEKEHKVFKMDQTLELGVPNK